MRVHMGLGVRHKSSSSRNKSSSLNAEDVGVDGRSSPRETTDEVSSLTMGVEARMESSGVLGSFDEGRKYSSEHKSWQKRSASSSESDGAKHRLVDLGLEKNALSAIAAAMEGLLW